MVPRNKKSAHNHGHRVELMFDDFSIGGSLPFKFPSGLYGWNIANVGAFTKTPYPSFG
jgi:hypothetical protein